MSLSAFSLASLRTQKRAKSMRLHNIPEIEIDTSLIKQIGNYRLGEEIGSGAFGKVILGLHIITGEKVAIKILDKLILSQTPEDYELVRQELNILRIVKHKYIVQLYEILETPQHIFIIMEYCEGQDIMDYILTRNRLSENESLKYFQQLINALFYLHGQNITHRDIKIDNLLLDRNLDLKLIDFGLSTKYRDDKLLNQPCGTVVYAAPEVLDCREYHGMLADVWSSGIVLFGMLSGFLPFGDPDDEINKKLILQGKIEIPKFFSREATDLLKHMLDVNPLTRYTLEDIMEHPWFNKNKFRLIPGIIIGMNKIPIDEKIVNLCVTYNADKEKVRASVLNNKFNNESALYYLLVKKLKACGNDSVSDLCSNKFIKYIRDDCKRIDYVEIQKKFEINYQKELEKIKKEQIYNNNYNVKEKEIDLGAAPGLINEYNFKKYNYNLINIENNCISNNNSENFDDSDIINIDEKENSSMNNSRLRVNLGETEFNKNEIDNDENEDYNEEKIMPITHRIFTKGKLDPIIFNKNDFFKIDKKVNAGLNINKYNKDGNNKTIEKYIIEQKRKINNKLFKINIIKKNNNNISKNKAPLTSRNEYNNNESNTHLYSTQVSNYKKNKRKINPLQKDFYKKLNIKKNKENASKINIINKNIQEKKEKLLKDSTKNKLNININNKQNKISYKKIKNKKKNDNSNEIVNNKYISNHNKSIDSRNKLSIHKNNELSSNLFKTIYNNKNNNPILLNNNKEKNITKTNKNNVKDFYKNKINSKSIESRQKFMIDSTSKDKKINKINVMNLIDNFHLYQNAKDNIKNNNKKNNNINKSKINKSSIVTNNNSKYKFNYKKEFSFVHSPLLTIDNNNLQEEQNKNNGFNTDRTRNIYNLKKHFEKENNFTNSNNKIKSRKIINHININNIQIKSNQNDLIRMKIKDYYLKKKKIENLNIKDFNNTSFSMGGTKINNSLPQTTFNTVNSNNNNQITKNNINLNSLNNDKCNTSRINVSLKIKKIKEKKNDNNMHKKMNTSILSSINKLKEYKKLKTKKINPKINLDNNNSKLNTLIKNGFIPNYKIKANNSLSKNKDKNKKENINKVNKKTHHLESSVVVFRKKSPFKIRDLSDSPKQKYLNEKTRNNRIPWKIKKKGIDEKLDGLSIYNRYINQFQIKNNNPFKKRNILKKNYKNKNEKNYSFLNNSKIKSNKNSLMPSTSNQKTLNISFSNYNNNNIFLKDKENLQFNPNGTSQGFYKYVKIRNIYSNNINNIEEYKKKDFSYLKNNKIKQGNKANFQRRNERSLNSNIDYTNLTQNYNSNNNEFQIKKCINVSIKKKFNKSISFGSLQSLNEDENNNKYEFEEPFDLSCLFITNNKVNECYNSFGNKLKKIGINYYQKKNIFYCNKIGFECQIIVFKYNNNNKNLICYKAIDKKKRYNKINEIFSKLFFNNNN